MWSRAGLAESVAHWIAGVQAATAVIIPPKEKAVADWLSGNRVACESLVNLLNSRVEGRGLLPVPSNPHEAMVNVGRDREARELARLLLSLEQAPVSEGNGEAE